MVKKSIRNKEIIIFKDFKISEYFRRILNIGKVEEKNKNIHNEKNQRKKHF